MASNHDSGESSRIAADVPTNQKEALFLLAKHRSMNQREQVSAAQIVREFVAEGLARVDESGELPEEARDLLDEDLKANGGNAGQEADA